MLRYIERFLSDRRTLIKRIEELETDLAFWKENTRVVQGLAGDMKRRSDRMHRRAQRAEGLLAKAKPQPSYLMELHQRNAQAFETRSMFAENMLKIAYRHLHTAWLRYTTITPATLKDITDANEVSSIEAMLRDEYPGIELPPKPEGFSHGTRQETPT